MTLRGYEWGANSEPALSITRPDGSSLSLVSTTAPAELPPTSVAGEPAAALVRLSILNLSTSAFMELRGGIIHAGRVKTSPFRFAFIKDDDATCP